MENLEINSSGHISLTNPDPTHAWKVTNSKGEELYSITSGINNVAIGHTAGTSPYAIGSSVGTHTFVVSPSGGYIRGGSFGTSSRGWEQTLNPIYEMRDFSEDPILNELLNILWDEIEPRIDQSDVQVPEDYFFPSPHSGAGTITWTAPTSTYYTTGSAPSITGTLGTVYVDSTTGEIIWK